MPWVTAAIAAVGLGMQIFGASEQSDIAKQQAAVAAQQAEIQRQINAQQRAALEQQQKVADIQFKQAYGQLGASKEVVGKQLEIEGIKLQAATLEATKKKREAIRDMIIARAQGQAVSTGKGASTSDSSVAGARAQAENRGYGNVNYLNQSLELGRNVFDVNKQITDIYLGVQSASQGYLTESYEAEKNVRGIQQNIFNLNDTQATLASRMAALGGDMSSAQGITAIGGSLLGNSTAIGNVGSTVVTGAGNMFNNGGMQNFFKLFG